MKKNKETEKNKEQREIIEELENLKTKIDFNEAMFNLTSENDLVDAIIYEQKSLRSKYSYLLKLAKEKEIKIDFLTK